MLKKPRNKQIAIGATAAVTALVLGAAISFTGVDRQVVQWFSKTPSQSQPQEQQQPKSAVLPLVSLSPSQRQQKLEAIANSSPLSPDRNRARYLLASDLLNQKQGEAALKYLEGLEKDYPALAPHILLQQAQAQEFAGAKVKAGELRERVVKEYPQDPATAKALYLLGQRDPKYYQQALTKFPSHPLTWEIARNGLQTNPSPQLLLVLARHAYDQADILPILDQLIQPQNAAILKPQDWEIIGTGYWRNNQLAQAGIAYAKAPRTPRNLFRAARGHQIGGKRDQAIATYQQLASAFPTAPETGKAMLQLAVMARTPQDTLTYLDKAIAQFPDQAGQALVRKAAILEAQNSKQSAQQALRTLVNKHGDSDAAAEYRWKVALDKAATQDYKAAWQWAEPITTNNPSHILAPRAGFWVGKWATKLGRPKEAQEAYEYVLSQFPYSYYAWRSAAILGQNVGNFNTVRQMNPTVVTPQRPVLPAGSEALKELYLLGQDQTAWMQWQSEFRNKMQPTIAEQFTDGLMSLARGENLIGIDKISTLEDRETPEEKAQYQELSKTITYWQARYPFPYLNEIEKWSQERKINPLLVTALMRQESRFERKIRSVVGATGLMQIMPDTAKWIAPQINLPKYDLENPNDNIAMGTFYLDHTHQQYDNNSLLAIASYNAGPGNVAKWLRQLGKTDPDEFVEAIPFDETKNYVRQVFGNYWNYLRLYNPEISQIVAKYSEEHPKLPQE